MTRKLECEKHGEFFKPGDGCRICKSEAEAPKKPGGVSLLSPPGGAVTPDSRERPALIGDQVDSDIAYLKTLGTPAFPSEVIGKNAARRIAEIATRYEIIAGAYFASWKRESHILEREREE